MRWIIGDIHGMLEPLDVLVSEVRRIDPDSRLYFAGDYVNRGPNSRGVIDFLIKLKGGTFIRGNHDDIFDSIVNGAAYAERAQDADRIIGFRWFMEHGLDATFESYGVDYAELEHMAARPTVARLEKIIAAVPAEHRQFVRRLPPLIEDPDMFVAHAKWDCDEMDLPRPMLEQLQHDQSVRHKLLWGRYGDDEIHRAKAWSRTGYFGHTPTYVYAASQETGELLMLPIAGRKMVLVDTAAALIAAGRLTAFCHEEQFFVQVDRFGEIVKVGQ